MAYSAPELLLVGAAQNLVLDTSGAHNLTSPCTVDSLEDNGITYDDTGLW